MHLRGRHKVAAGRFQIDVTNLTRDGASFVFARLANGFTAATIKPILAKETAWGRSLTRIERREILEGKLPLQRACQLGRIQERRFAAMLVGALFVSLVRCVPSGFIVKTPAVVAIAILVPSGAQTGGPATPRVEQAVDPAEPESWRPDGVTSRMPVSRLSLKGGMPQAAR
jgi:hypothetical protein